MFERLSGSPNDKLYWNNETDNYRPIKCLTDGFIRHVDWIYIYFGLKWQFLLRDKYKTEIVNYGTDPKSWNRHNYRVCNVWKENVTLIWLVECDDV